MKSKILLAALAVSIAAPVAMPAPSFAKDRTYSRDRQDYRYRCKSSKGTTGLVAGGAGGALVGNAVGGGLLGTVAGGVGGALLGKHIDKKEHEKRNRRRGC